jgi:predicted metalloprotease with PDZ domain
MMPGHHPGLPLHRNAMKTLLSLGLLLIPTLALAQRPVEYEVAFPNAAHHEAEVAVTFTDVPDGPLEVRMSRTSPGRYALHEFAKNVYDVRAVNRRGEPLTVTRPNPHQWNVTEHDGTVRFSYTLFADRADGTYSGIDNTHAHLNIPATFAWARGLEDRPVVVTFDRPDPEWEIATQLVPTTDPERFTAPHLQYFMDSPTEISDQTVRSWTVGPQTIRIALHHAGTEAEADAYAEMAKKIVAEQQAIFGELPRFDHGTYTFLADYLPHVAGDGMEHRNSTILTSTRPLSTGAIANLGTLAHEFLHSWNIERIRPDALEPFDFERANTSGALWFGEGFTSYYDDLSIKRAGIIPLEEYAQRISGPVNYVINAPGRQFFSPVEMSLQAPFVDAAASIDPQNKPNTFISYYTWGSVIGLGLDLTLRERFGLSLDDYMRAVWRKYGRAERPYTLDDLRTTLAEVTGDAAFAEEFFRRYVHGREVPDYARLLSQAGLLLRKAQPGEAWLGDPRIEYEDGEAVLTGPTLIGTPLYEAGVDRGDRIVSLGGRAITTEADLEAVLAAHQPGDALPIEFEQRGQLRTAVLTLAENPELGIVTFEEAGRTVTPEMRAFREAWLGSKAK